MSNNNEFNEKQLIYPALFIINKFDNEINIGALIEKLEAALDVSEKDNELLFGRTDTRFSQKVKNLVSHNTLMEYVDYSDPEARTFKINNNGLKYLEDKGNCEVVFSEFEETETEFDIVDSFPNIREFIHDSDIRVNLASQTVYELYRRFKITSTGKSGGLILDDSFQRNSVWKVRQKSQLIESLLLGIPLPLFYLAEDKLANLIVVDGRQRLTAIFDFLSGNYKLRGLQMLQELNGKKISDFTGELETLQARIEDSFLYVARIDKNTPEIIKLQLFSRVNRNGTPLNAQEVRHALHQGGVTVLLESLSNKVNMNVSRSRMKDRQYILRALAMQLLYRDELFNFETGEEVVYSTIDRYLGEAMDAINTFTEDQIQCVENDFVIIFNRALSVFGRNAFRLKEKSPINMILFEVTLLIVRIFYDESDETIEAIFEEYKNYSDNDVTYDDSESSWLENNLRFHRDAKENFNERIYVINKLKGLYNDKTYKD